MKLKIGIIIIFFLFALVSCKQNNDSIKKPVAVNGILDLRDWDFSKDGSINLDGEWEFYWDQFLLEDDFDSYTETDDKNYIPVPGVWKGYELEGEKLPGLGFSTYRLTVLLNPELVSKSLAINIPTISTSYTLFLDGMIIASSGKITKTGKDSIPEARTQITTFKPETSKIELVFQVSNYWYTKGGLWYSITFGLEDDIRIRRNSDFYIDLFLFGSIFIMGIYHISIFLLRRKEKASLAFGIFSILVSFRLLFVGQLFINILFTSFSWSLLVRLEYLFFYLSFPIYLTFIRYLFPLDVSRLFLSSFRAISLLFVLVVIITPVRVFTGAIIYFQLLAVLGGFYLIFLHIVTIRRKRDHSQIISLGFIILFLSMLNDILFANGIINTGDFFPAGLFIFVLIQAFTLAGRFIKSFDSVEQLSKDISEAEEKYRSIFENSSDGIYQSFVEGRFLIVNSAFAKILGYDSSEEILKINHIQNWYVDFDERQSLIESLIADGVVENIESRVYKKNGEIIYIKENAHAVFGRDGEIKYIEGNIVDITESRQIEQLKLEREAAEAASKTKSEFLANMSHEIRTPMNAILGFTDLLFDSEKDLKRKDQLGIVKNAGKDLLKLINDILDFSKIEAGKLDISEDVFSITELINKSKNLFMPKAVDKGLDLIVDFGQGIPNLVFGDRYRLAQILNNIIGNALKFTEKGGITIACAYKNENLILSVRDSGIGISEDKLNSIFLSFTQADMSTAREYGGTGLGLSISKKLVELIGGHISLESKPGVGTTFFIEIPLRISENKIDKIAK